MDALIITILISGIIAITGVTIFLLFKYSKSYYKNYVKEPLSSCYHETVICPRCSLQMLKGLICSERGIYYYSKEEAESWKSRMKVKALDNSMGMGLKTPFLKSWKCPSCKIVVADYSKHYV